MGKSPRWLDSKAGTTVSESTSPEGPQGGGLATVETAVFFWHWWLLVGDAQSLGGASEELLKECLYLKVELANNSFCCSRSSRTRT